MTAPRPLPKIQGPCPGLRLFPALHPNQYYQAYTVSLLYNKENIISIGSVYYLLVQEMTPHPLHGFAEAYAPILWHLERNFGSSGGTLAPHLWKAVQSCGNSELLPGNSDFFSPASLQQSSHITHLCTVSSVIWYIPLDHDRAFSSVLVGLLTTFARPFTFILLQYSQDIIIKAAECFHNKIWGYWASLAGCFSACHLPQMACRLPI